MYPYGDADLDKKRAEQEHRLKSRFESIFEKYEKSFDGIGDEIDLETGEVVTDHGHLKHMRYDTDVGNGLQDKIVEALDLKNLDSSDGASSFGSAEQSDGSSIDDAATENTDGNETGVLPHDLQSNNTGMDKGHETIRGSDELSLERQDLQDAEEDEDELAVGMHGKMSLKDAHHRSATKVVKATTKTDPKWSAPPLPYDSCKTKPVHRRIAQPLPQRIVSYDVNLGDWRQKNSIWDRRPEASPKKAKHQAWRDDSQSKGVIEEGPNNDDDWTDLDLQLLCELKQTRGLSNDMLVKYFPGKSTTSIKASWEGMRLPRKKGGFYTKIQVRAESFPHPSSSSDRVVPLENVLDSADNEACGREVIVLDDSDTDDSHSIPFLVQSTGPGSRKAGIQQIDKSSRIGSPTTTPSSRKSGNNLGSSKKQRRTDGCLHYATPIHRRNHSARSGTHTEPTFTAVPKIPHVDLPRGSEILDARAFSKRQPEILDLISIVSDSETSDDCLREDEKPIFSSRAATTGFGSTSSNNKVQSQVSRSRIDNRKLDVLPESRQPQEVFYDARYIEAGAVTQTNAENEGFFSRSSNHGLASHGDGSREIPDSQPSQTQSSSGCDRTSSFCDINAAHQIFIQSPSGSKRAGFGNQNDPRSRNKELPKSADVPESRSVKSAWSPQAKRITENSRIGSSRPRKPPTMCGLSLSQLCDESDDDLSISRSTMVTPRKVAHPAHRLEARNGIPPEMKECSEDELG